MSITYLFTEDTTAWLLLKNKVVYKGYPKNRFLKSEVEEKISKVICKSIRRYGWKNVSYAANLVNCKENL